MPKLPKPEEKPKYYERRRFEFYPLLIAFIFIPLGFVFAFFTPQVGGPVYLSRVSDWELWLTLPFGVVGAAVLTAASLFDAQTKKVMSPNKLTRLARPIPLSVQTRYYHPDATLSGEMLTEKEKAELESASRIEPGTDGGGGVVGLSLLSHGGYDAYFYHSKYAGDQGFSLLEGKGQLIQLSTGWVMPHVLETVDHSHLPSGLLTILEQQENFIYGKTPIYRVGPLAPEFVEWLQTNPYAQATVVAYLGVDFFVERATAKAIARLALLASNGKIPGLEPGKNLPEAKLEELVREELKTRLQREPMIRFATGSGMATLDYYRTGYWGLHAEVNRLTQALTEAQDEAANLRRGATARAAKLARSAGGGGVIPAGLEIARRTPTAAEEEY